MARITHPQVQQFVDALVADGLKPASVSLERALLRRFFNCASTHWSWNEPACNPARGLALPPIDNSRDRVLGQDEQQRLETAFELCQNEVVAPAATLLRETAMRSSELLGACWQQVDWQQRVLHLSVAKAGKRDVPLSPVAIEVLKSLPHGEPTDPVLGITYEALKAAWQRACARAGVEDLNLHDLRHTCATRFALEHGGNIWLLKALTGHKTMSQLERYVNIKASDVVEVMHGSAAAAIPSAPAAEPIACPQSALVPPVPAAVKPQDGVVVRVDFTRRRVA